ncbi:hypothetical protein [Gloeocapsa sp. PCC 73106]|uniref:hypothetical protein n=1 Tax=Gloeocapsa sp. PCC 73106 TaxID=102232 RepID=UPI0002ABFEFF|nr:hypothetical protein [Gloeocapsa sp. PCC 73106]ELR98514.1 hypothetical protein GLO73106DRAFT_00023470 [Gloeocapsa sp. PCC 73106]
MQLLDDNKTIWAFISGSDEDRFVNDISFGVSCLRHRRFPSINILLFIDQLKDLESNLTDKFPSDVNIYRTSSIESKLSEKNPKNLVIIVTGHGSDKGIDTNPPMLPYQFLSILKKNPELEYALVVLGQCFAGTFNFLEAKSKDPQTGTVISPELCIIGAANLTYSISVTIDIEGLPQFEEFSCVKNWCANLFLFFFLLHIAYPKDLDGDGKITVLDTYKAAAIFTTEELIENRQKAFKNIIERLLPTRQDISQIEDSFKVSEKLAEQAREDLIKAYETLLINQDCWILNANLARELKL